MTTSTIPTRIWTTSFFALIFIISSYSVALGIDKSSGKSILIDDFSGGISSHWQTKSFKGQTSYQISSIEGSNFLSATSKDSASGLFYNIDYEPKNYPFISWKWRIKNILPTGDAKTKEGDDYAARIYVVFPGYFFWQTKALNYIWANKLPKGEFIKNSHTGNAVMIAIQSGNDKAGQWLTETRNIVQDYQKAFGQDPPKVGSIAIMTDTDNTGESAQAWYGTIKISSE